MVHYQDKPERLLCHYTSEAGLRGIFKAKKLWFSDLATANDPRELTLGYELLAEAIEALSKKTQSSAQKEFLANIEKALLSHRAHSQAFCCCFSLEPDALPMWREYGSNYAGYCIGFRPTAFGATSGRMQKAKYVDPSTLDELCALIEQAVEEYGPHSDNDIVKIAITGEILGAITPIKHQSWSYEKEFRIIHMQSIKQDEVIRETGMLPDKSYIYWTAPFIRDGRTGQVSYLEFGFGKYKNKQFDASSAIEEVIIGPNASLNEADVKSLLADGGFKNFTVRKSDCQIR